MRLRAGSGKRVVIMRLNPAALLARVWCHILKFQAIPQCSLESLFCGVDCCLTFFLALKTVTALTLHQLFKGFVWPTY